MNLYRLFILALITYIAMGLLLWAAPVKAEEEQWQARLHDVALPLRVVAVDKTRQIFHLYEKHSPLTLKFSYPCTTGQVEGDKQATNDLRTPEGVYFVEYKIAQGLDFKEYGGIAYTLNYPNPVDRLRGKTGHGIWIHSKGLGIVPRDTRGCIAIGLQEIDEVGPLLLPGTAVFIAPAIPSENIAVRDDGTARLLRQRMNQWTRAWAGRSSKLFEFYDPDAYSKAMPENFSAFRLNKERLFKRFNWIHIFNREVHVLEGPGYWVTWSEQFYRAPNLSTEGVRRLYWQRGKDSQFRIVGMEWLPRNVGMQAAYQKGQLVAAAEAPVSDARHSEAPMPPPLSMPEASSTVPPTVSLVPPPVSLALAPAEKQTAPSPAPVASSVINTPSQNIVLDAALTEAMQERMEAWAMAWQDRSPEFFAFYDQKRYGMLKDIPYPDTFAALKTDMTRRFHAPWLELLQRPAKVRVEGAYVVTSAAQWLREPGRAALQGIRTLYWQRTDAQSPLRIVASHWEAGDQGMQEDYLESISNQLSDIIEAWRVAWQSGNIEAYTRFYDAQARQQGKNMTAMREQKTRLWGTAPPVKVEFTGLRMLVDAVGVRVDMQQTYQDALGRGDKGTKTLRLHPTRDGWRIIQEDWTL